MRPFLDILIPVYNEGESVLRVLGFLVRDVKIPFRVLFCYDVDTDSTIRAVKNSSGFPMDIQWIKNQGHGVHGAIMSGFHASTAAAVLVYPADDDANTGIVNSLWEQFEKGSDIVAPSRFMRGGCMKGCRWTKALLVRASAFTLHYLAGVPTHDPSNGFRLFSRRVIDNIPVESTDGFAYSIELLVKCDRRGWKITEIPSQWFERKKGKSRFKIMKWLPVYLQWYFYAFVTPFIGRGKSAANGR